jgi:tRNA G37 N-methylase Trm5
MTKHRAFSVFGNLAVVNFPYGTKTLEKKKFANEILSKNKSIKTVLEKV